MTLCNDRGARQTERSPFFCLSALSHVGSGSADDCVMSWLETERNKAHLSVCQQTLHSSQSQPRHTTSTWPLCLMSVYRAVDQRPNHIFYCPLFPDFLLIIALHREHMINEYIFCKDFYQAAIFCTMYIWLCSVFTVFALFLFA